MDFNGITDALAYGRRVRRRAWEDGLFIESDGNNVWLRSENNGNRETVQHFCEGDRVFTFNDIWADDWMFYV